LSEIEHVLTSQNNLSIIEAKIIEQSSPE